MRTNLIFFTLCLSLLFAGNARALYKNVAGQSVTVYAYDTSGEASKTGDAANITAQISINRGASTATNDVNPTELEATDQPGIYYFNLTQAETNGDTVVISAVSSTADIWIKPLSIATRTVMRGTDAAALAGDAMTLTAAATSEQLVDDVWNESLTGASHNVPNSAGRRLRQIQEFQGYSLGAVWINTNGTNSGTVLYEDGTVENPVNNLADANTIATALEFVQFQIAPGSSLTFASSQNGQIFEGRAWVLALGGQSIEGLSVIGANVTGVGTATVVRPRFTSCHFGAVTLPPSIIDISGIGESKRILTFWSIYRIP